MFYDTNIVRTRILPFVPLAITVVALLTVKPLAELLPMATNVPGGKTRPFSPSADDVTVMLPLVSAL